MTAVQPEGRAVAAPRGLAADLLVAAWLVTYCAVGMWPFALRMANMHVDDGPIHYARVFAAPEHYDRDVVTGIPIDAVLHAKVATSVMVWVPALLWRFAGVDPFPVTWVLTAPQAILLGGSVYIASAAATRRRAVSFVAAVYALAAAPWVWAPVNFGNNSAWNFIPYAANLAIGPILIAIACVLRGRIVTAAMFLALGGLVHPLMG